MFLIVHHRVRDFDAWKSAFDQNASVRARYGCTGHTIYRSADDPNDVRIFTEWPSREKAEQYTRDPSLPEAMQRGGVIGEPHITFAEEAEITTYATSRAA